MWRPLFTVGGSVWGVSLNRDPSGQRPPWKEHGTRDRDPPKGSWDQTQREEVTSYRDPLPHVGRMTDMCKNVTLPQTSFAGGNNLFVMYTCAYKIRCPYLENSLLSGVAGRLRRYVGYVARLAQRVNTQRPALRVARQDGRVHQLRRLKQ